MRGGIQLVIIRSSVESVTSLFALLSSDSLISTVINAVQAQIEFHSHLMFDRDLVCKWRSVEGDETFCPHHPERLRDGQKNG